MADYGKHTTNWHGDLESVGRQLQDANPGLRRKWERGGQRAEVVCAKKEG